MRAADVQIYLTNVALVWVLAGCTGTAGHLSYSTTGKIPTRDTHAAQQSNQTGVQAVEQGDFPSAEQAFRDALASDITCAAAHNNLGLVLLRKKQYYEASWEFAYATKLEPEASAPKGNLGLVFEGLGKYDQAADSFETALKINPDDVQVMGHFARTLVKANQPAKQNRLRELLEVLVIRATPDWSDWAREQLIKLGSTARLDSNSVER